MLRRSSPPRKLFPRVRRLGRRGMTFLGTLGLIMLGLFVSTRPGMVLADVRDDVLQSIYEGKGLGAEGDPAKRIWEGVRYVIDPRAFVQSPAFRAEERIYGNDVLGNGRDEKLIESYLSRWQNQLGLSNAETKSIKEDGLSFLLSSRDQDSRGLTEQQEQEADKQDGFRWTTFLTEKAAYGENPWTRKSEARLLALRYAGLIGAAVSQVAPPGQTFPEFLEEDTPRVLPKSTHTPYQPSPPPAPNLDLIAKPASATQEVLDQIYKAPFEAVLNNPEPHNKLAATNPDEQLPSILGNEQSQQRVQSVAFGSAPENSAAGFGRGNELTGRAPAGNPLSESLIAQALVDQMAARTALVGQQQAASLAVGGSFFGPSTLGRLSSAFSPDTFQNLLSNLFRGGGGSSGGAGGGGLPEKFDQVPLEQSEATDPACPLPNAQLSAREAAGIALLEGLPSTSSDQQPWTATYLSAAQLLSGITGTDLSSGSQRTLSPTDFGGPGTCIWVIGTRTELGGIEITALEDRLAPTATRIQLTIP